MSDYLEVLRERFGDDAGTREPDPADEWAETYSPCHPGCACDALADIEPDDDAVASRPSRSRE